GQEAGLLQRRAVLTVMLAERTGDGQAQGPRLSGDTAAAQVGDDVNAFQLVDGGQGLTDQLLVHLAREVVLKLTTVADNLPGSGQDTHPDDGLLATAHGLDGAVAAIYAPGRRGRRSLGNGGGVGHAASFARACA